MKNALSNDYRLKGNASSRKYSSSRDHIEFLRLLAIKKEEIRLRERPSAFAKKELAEIQSALDRLQESLFGICEECQQAILLERLRTIPYARHCLECQKELEERRSHNTRPSAWT